MRLVLLSSLLFLAACASSSPSVAVVAADAPAADPADVAAVHAAVTDYLEALYQADPERIRRSVHPSLRKLGFWRAEGQADYGPAQEMTYEQLLDLAATWNAADRLPPDAPRHIVVLDVQDQIACARLDADWGSDYFELGRVDGRWMIFNIIWRGPTPSAG